MNGWIIAGPTLNDPPPTDSLYEPLPSHEGESAMEKYVNSFPRPKRKGGDF